MEGNKYFDELKRAFGFECYIADVFSYRGKDIDYVAYQSESADGYILYVLKEAGKDVQIMTDIFNSQYTLIDSIRDILMDGDKICIDDHLAMWLDMDTGTYPDDFWENFYVWAVDKKYITDTLA